MVAGIGDALVARGISGNSLHVPAGAMVTGKREDSCTR
jgi:hypothetical protein